MSPVSSSIATNDKGQQRVNASVAPSSQAFAGILVHGIDSLRIEIAIAIEIGLVASVLLTIFSGSSD